MHSLYDQAAMALIEKRRRLFRLPKSTKTLLGSSLTKLREASGSRAWGLPSTLFTEEIKYYNVRQKSLNDKTIRPRLRRKTTSELAEEMSLKIDAALNFVELGKNAELLIKPILLYYASTHLCGVYTRAFFCWDNEGKPSHGLNCTHHSDIEKTTIEIKTKGQFARTVVTCFILTGQPNCFSPLVTYSAKPSSHLELLSNFGQEERGDPITSLTLAELLNFDFKSKLYTVRTRHGFHKFNGLPTTAFLVDIIILFVASSLARYDLVGWKKILEGKDNSYRIIFEEAFDRFLNFGIDAILRALEKPLLDFDERLLVPQPSPYSHDNKYRFISDPNCD